MAIRLLIWVIALAPAFAQNTQIRITGDVPCAGDLRLRNAAPGYEVESASRVVRLKVKGARGDAAPVVLSLRTNCRYSISAEWSGTEQSQMTLPAASLTPAAGGAHLTPEALRARVVDSELRSNSPTICITGGRVSRAGNDLTPDNAVIIEFAPLITSSAAGGVLSFSLRLGG